MNPPDHDLVSELFEQAVDLELSERSAFLDRACGGHTALRGKVEQLLANDAQGVILNGPAIAEQLLNSDRVDGLPAPNQVASYRILGVLGRGGMGIVYRAEQERPHRTVALKLIRPGLLSDRLLKRFEYEVEILGRLQHPGIAQIFEAGVTTTVLGPQPYFAMELIEGRTLIDHVNRKKLGTRERLGLFVKICDAVQHAHQRGVIHRDLKPGNILVDGNGQPKVLDFGIARPIDSDMQSTTLQTDIGQLVGTLTYMSPEQAMGNVQDIDTRSDVYTLGVILYELLTERLPYPLREKATLEAVRIVREDDPTPPSTLQKSLRGDVETIVLKALEKEKTRRYASAAELAVDIERFLRDKPILARPASKLYQLQKFAKRHKGWVGGVVLAFLALSVGLAAAMLARDSAKRARADAEQNALVAKRTLSVSGIERLRELRTEMDQRWPRWPMMIEPMAKWLVRAEQEAALLPQYETYLAEVRAIANRTNDEDWLLNRLVALIADLKTFTDPDPKVGLIANVKVRLEIARTIEQRSIENHAGRWNDWVEDVALAVDASPSDEFGCSVALDGDVLAVGAVFHDHPTLTDSGAAYVYRWNGVKWALEAELLPLAIKSADFLGGSVAVAGDWLFVSAQKRRADSIANGVVYIYYHDAGGWHEHSCLLSQDAHAIEFGHSVASDGNIVVIGDQQDNEGGQYTGAAYVFRRYDRGTSSLSDDTWGPAPERRLKASDRHDHDAFGFKVSLWGDLIAVGAPLRDSGKGAVYTFEYAAGSWVQANPLITASCGAANDQFGYSLQCKGDRIAVGAPNRNALAGALYVYRKTPGGWVEEVGPLQAPDTAPGDRVGVSVSLEGPLIIAGAYLQDPAGLADAGAVYAFRLGSSGVWSYRSKITAPDAEAGDIFGIAVSASGQRAVIGACASEQPAGPSDAGAAWVVRVDGIEQYGQSCFVGWPGTNGIPGLTAPLPILCNTLVLHIGNSLGSSTTGFFFLGCGEQCVQTGYGDKLLIGPTYLAPFPLPGSGLDLPVTIPYDCTLERLAAYLQVLELDSGASDGVSSSPCLELTLGF